MKIVKKQLSDLKEAPYNPRISVRDNPEFYKKLKASIDKFGYIEPIIYNIRTGNVVGGNQRLQILKDNGMTEEDCIEVDIAEDDEKALNLALNKVSGEWDPPKLNALLMNLKDLDYNNMDVTGFDSIEIGELFDQYNEVKEEDVFEPPKEPKYTVNTGDIYQIGNHRLMCGDSSKKDDINKLMNGLKAQLVITSPPYFNQREYSQFETINDYNDLIYNVAKQLPLDDNSVICWNVGGGEAENYDIQALNSVQLLKAELTFSDCIVWRKKGGVFDIPRSMHIENNIYYPAFGYELIFIYKNGKMPHFEPSDHDLAREYQINVWDIPQVKTNKESDNEGHPAAYPVKLPELCIRFYSTKNKNVFDPFGGSGSTMIACEQTQRNCYMMELDPTYCSVIIERWETYTGKQHVKVNA